MIKSKITVAVVAALAFSYGGALYAQSTDTTQTASPTTTGQAPSATKAKAKTKNLKAVTVTGSLIPSTEIETAQPIVTITADEIKARGFTTVAQALQQSSFATGAVQGAQSTNSFTTGAKTLSFFGLPVGFTKYLIDGRPMGSFPGLYNGSQSFNNISGIPVALVDHIDILPGGQSSLYGSDAIAGVINIVLKKHIGAPEMDYRYGFHTGGGGATNRISFADDFTVGKFTSLVGVQFENTQPIWKKDRALTSQFYKDGTSPQTASRDYLVLSAGGADRGYLFLDPNNCANITQGFNGTEGKRHRNGSGDYCGSFYTPGEGTLSNKDKTANFYTHNTFDVTDNFQLYGDLLYNYEENKYTNGSSTSFWSSSLYAAPGGYFFDPRRGDLPLVQHAFTPEEVGGYSHIMSKQIENSYLLTLGGRGTIGQSNWDYDLSFTHSDDHVINRNHQRFTAPLESYYKNHVLGPQMGTYYGYPVFEPNYAALYNPVSQADYDSFTGYTTTHSKTWDNMLRGQLTNASLFSLPGGDAGVAVVVEGGNQGFDITPDPRLLQTITDPYGNQSPAVWGTSATPAAGHRSRYAATTEFKFPVLSQITLDVAGRYDSYLVSGARVSHGTYNLGLEYRPFETLLLRGRYGTAFKVPTLADEFQRPSGFFGFVRDDLNCGRLGFDPTDANCPVPYNSEQYKGTQQGNPDLKPITAKVWSYGFVWAPLDRMSISVDYLHYDINNEVTATGAGTLSNTQYLCDIGTIDAGTSTCSNAFALVTRGPGRTVDGVPLLGLITAVNQKKLNQANEQVNALTASFHYVLKLGSFGDLAYSMNYSDTLKHTAQDFIVDPPVDYLRHPGYSYDFKTKTNASLTWSRNAWSATAYVNRYGRSPNYAARQSDTYDPTVAKGAGKYGAYIFWNATVTYNPSDALALSVLVNNVFDKMPPMDHTYPGTSGQPYNTLNYNVYGRAIYLEANYKFGKGS